MRPLVRFPTAGTSADGSNVSQAATSCINRPRRRASMPLMEPPSLAVICSRKAMDVQVRTVSPNESTRIFSFLALAARMQESGEPIQKALRDHELTRYWRNWGRPGDLGLVAESDRVGYPVSCAWVRLFSREEAGADYVGEKIPELAIGTIPAARGLGVGTRLLEAPLDLCRSRYSGVSPSVRSPIAGTPRPDWLSSSSSPSTRAKHSSTLASRSSIPSIRADSRKTSPASATPTSGCR